MDDIAQMMMSETEHYDTAYEAGIEVGTERGFSLGISQGKIDVAKNLIDENINIKTIMNVTGLTQEEIESLR